MAEPPKTLWDYFRAGGPLMWPILACSIIALAFVFERFIVLRRSRVIDEVGYREVFGLLGSGGVLPALELARSRSSPLYRVLAGVLSCAKGPRAEMEAVVENAGARELWELNRNAKPLGIIAQVAPLLGLLGTVFGIIRAFSKMAASEAAVGNPKQLAGGIYEALITTAAGLTVAIPVFLFFHYFTTKTDSLLREIEEKALEVIAVLTGGGDGDGTGAGGADHEGA